MTFRRLEVVAVATVILASPVAGQLPSPGTAALGMGDNYTAAARGFTAIAWNPAGLGLSGNQGASATLLTLRGVNGIGPITLSDLSSYSDAVVPDAVKLDWLTRIASAGGQTGMGEAAATWGAFQVGRFAMQLGSVARGVTDFSPGVAELVMFGNGGEQGQSASLDLSGSSLSGYAYTTAAAGFAQPVAFEGGRLSLGVAVKWTAGHALAFGENSTGGTTSDPITLRLDFPMVQTSLNPDSLKFDNGSGWGVDVGAGLELGMWTFAAAVQNVYNGFAWDTAGLRYRPLSIAFDGAESDTDTEAVPFAQAPAPVRQRVADLGFEPVLAFGMLVRPSARLAVTGDFRRTSDSGMTAGPVLHAGAGLQYRLAPWLPVRLGGAMVSMGENDSGYQLAGGFGLDIRGWNLSASAARRDTDRFGTANTIMVTVFATGLGM